MNSHSAHGITALIFITMSLLISSCASTRVNDTKTYIKPTQPINNIRVIYLANTLKSDKFDFDPAVSTGYRNLPQLLQQRVPLVFGLNSITADYLAVSSTNKSAIAENGNISFNNGKVSKLLVLQIKNGVVFQSQSGKSTILNWEATLSDTKANAEIWTGHFKSELDYALLVKQYYNNEYVDNFLKAVLEQMAKDGLIVLANNTAVIPTPENKDNPTKLPLPSQTSISHKVPTFKGFISKLDVITEYNSSPQGVVDLNNRLTTAIIRALKNTCVKEVNGLPALDKGKPDAGQPDMNFVLVVKPVRRIKIEGLQSDTIRFSATLHQVNDENSKPNPENMVWDAEEPVTKSAFQPKPENVNESATDLIKLMIKDSLIRETCN